MLEVKFPIRSLHCKRARKQIKRRHWLALTVADATTRLRSRPILEDSMKLSSSRCGFGKFYRSRCNGRQSEEITVKTTMLIKIWTGFGLCIAVKGRVPAQNERCN